MTKAEYDREYYLKHKDKILSRWKEKHAKSAARKRASDAYLARYPERHRARQAVNNAVRDGRLDKKPCFICGEPKVEAHHEDYSKLLDVIWFCNFHHREHEGRIALAIEESK